MNLPEFQELDLSIARNRIALSLIAMLSLYVDPSTAGGLFHLSAYALMTLLCHLAYGIAMYQGEHGFLHAAQIHTKPRILVLLCASETGVSQRPWRLRKVYRVVPDPAAERHRLMRIVDESG